MADHQDIDTTHALAVQIGQHHQLAGIPAVANSGIKFIDNGFFRDRMLKALYKKAQGPQHTYK